MNAARPLDEGRLRSSADRVRQEFDRWLEALWSQGERAMDAIGIRPEAVPVDIFERENAIVVRANVPGLSGQDLDVTLAGHMLTLKGEFPVESSQAGETAHQTERSTGKFQRSIPLPASVDPDTIQAECRNGVLEITVSKVEREKARQIPVRSAMPGESTAAPETSGA
jgi:HSP20 family protein